MTIETYLYENRADGKRRQINKIHATSLFFGFKVPKDIAASQHTAKSQLWIANKLRAGWITNASMDPLKLSISQLIRGKGEDQWTHNLERRAA